MMRNTFFIKKNNRGFLLEIEGNSMFPILKNGDKAIVNSKFNRISVGDIVVFVQKDKLISHRVIYVKENKIITKGDNNLYTDSPILRDQIIGKITSVLRESEILDISDFYILHSLVYFEEIKRLISIFNKEMIDYVFLKGLILYFYFEKDFPVYFPKDYDILIHPDQKEKVFSILEKLGYKKVTPYFKIPFSKTTSFLYCKKVSESFIFLDLHLDVNFLMSQVDIPDFIYKKDLVNKFSKTILTKKKYIEVKSMRVAILPNDYLIVYLALHIFHHNFRGWSQYKLLNNIVSNISKNDKILWIKIEEIIRSYSIGSFISPVFFILKRNYDSPIPDDFLNKLRKQYMSKLSFSIIKNPLSVFYFSDFFSDGLLRLKNILLLSPGHPLQKVRFFFDVKIIITIFWFVNVRVVIFISSLFFLLKRRFF